MLAKVLKIIFSKNYNNNALYGINDKLSDFKCWNRMEYETS